MAKSEDSLNEPTMAQVLARMAAIQEELLRSQQGHQIIEREQLKQTRRKSNSQAPLASVFNPRGEKDFPMPRLACEVLMPFTQRPELHGMDREEVELMNLLVEDVRDRLLNHQAPEYSVELNDGSSVRLNIETSFNRKTNTVERIRWCGPDDPDTRMPTPFFTTENKNQFRPMREILRSILPEEKTARVMPMRVEYKKVEEFAKLDAFDRTDRAKHADAYVQHATADHVGPLAFSIGD